jgi:hypothetical protein
MRVSAYLIGVVGRLIRHAAEVANSGHRPRDHARMRHLLDDEVLSGAYDVTTYLRPYRTPRCVATMDSLLACIDWLCQVWGGNSNPLLPIEDGHVPAAYMGCLERDVYDRLDVEWIDDLDLGLPSRISTGHGNDFLAALILQHRPRDDWRKPFHVVDLEPTDPWLPIYAATLGHLPPAPDPKLCERSLANAEWAFDDVAPFERFRVVGSLEDLLHRLRDRTAWSPRDYAGMFLSSGMSPDTGYMGDSSTVLPTPWRVMRATGPNLIVVVSPDSLGDVALLWNLRQAHGDGRALPIGIPKSIAAKDVLQSLQQPGIATPFGWAGGGCRLVSTSVSQDELAALADDVPAMETAQWSELMTFGPPASRPRTQVVIFNEGQARLSPMADADLEVLGSAHGVRSPALLLDVDVTDHPLPRDLTMRGSGLAPNFCGGRAQVQIRSDRIEGATVSWPSTWTALSAVAKTRGLHITQSQEGRAASALIRSLGSVGEIRWLLHAGLVAMLYRLAEREGMTWQRAQIQRLRRSVRSPGWGDAQVEQAEAELDRAEAELAEGRNAVTPAGQGRSIGFHQIRQALGVSENGAAAWVEWAERRHVLVRGATVMCSDCGAESWLPLASLPPPIGCPGCGRVIDLPWSPAHLKFAYRLGEPLRRVLETDSLGHLFALRWFALLFDDSRGLVGAHPGVTFRRAEDASHSTIGEADVLLLFRDGLLVPIEVKLRADGVTDAAAATLDSLSDALAAPFDAFAVSAPARDCSGIERFARIDAPRNRVILTNDQMLDVQVFWALGANPFAFEPRPQGEDDERDRKFTTRLSDDGPDERFDPVRWSLLDDR